MSGRSSRMLKMSLLGDGGVGKSSLMNRFMCNKFDAQSSHTIVEFHNEDVVVDGDMYTMQICWDTNGQERYKKLRTRVYRGTVCCLLTFSLDNQQSFNNLTTWYDEFVSYANVELQQPDHVVR